MKKLMVGVVALTLVGAVAGCSASTKDVPGPTTSVTATATFYETATAVVTTTPVIQRVIATRTRTVTVTYTPHYDRYGQGIYVVGKDIQPGMYHTSGTTSDGICYWARLASLDTSNIIDNSNITGPQTVQIQSSDRAFEIQGDCTFGRA